MFSSTQFKSVIAAGGAAISYFDKVMISADKTKLATGETCIISFRWQKFDVNIGQHIDNPDNSADILVQIAGATYQIPPQETIEFISDEPGTYNVTITNPFTESNGPLTLEVV